MPDAVRWYLGVDGKTCGPYTVEQVKAVMEVGRADAETPACAEGDSVWMPMVDALPALFEAPAADLELELQPEEALPPPLPPPSASPAPPVSFTEEAQTITASLPARKNLLPSEIAQHCGVTILQVLHWIREGHLPAHKIGGRGDPVVKTEDFIAFCRTHQIPVPGADKSPGRRALIIDDDEDITAVIDMVLHKAGFETFVARDGFVGGSVLESFRPRVVTLDLLMPGLGGMSVLKFIRDKAHAIGTKILVVSVLPQDKLDEALRAGADAALSKPFDPEVLRQRVLELAGEP
jgi:two-component system, OmpR family, response regulator VicR